MRRKLNLDSVSDFAMKFTAIAFCIFITFIMVCAGFKAVTYKNETKNDEPKMIEKIDKPLEKDIEKKMREIAEKAGCMLVKMQGIGNKGRSDRLLVASRGRVVWIETKRPGEPLKPHQEWRKEQLEKLGHTVECFSSAQEFYEFLIVFLRE